VTINRTPAFRVIFNPRPRQYGIAMRESGYASGYQPGRMTKTILSIPRRKARSGLRVTIPDVAPGVYIVLIFDGTEGGSHKTWDYYQVLGPPPSARAAREHDSDRAAASTSPPTSGGDDRSAGPVLALGALVAALALVTLVMRRRPHRSA
jgi:hypothetical protein